MRVSVLHSERVELPDGSKGEDVLAKFKYPAESTIYVNGVPVPPDYVLSDRDEVFLRRPASGIVAGAPLEGLDPLAEFAAGAKGLIVIDPYILCPPAPRPRTTQAENGENYAEVLAAVVGAKTLKHLHIVFMEGNRYTRPAFEHACQRDGCQLTMVRSEKIHDRIWIRDNRRGLAAGTSLNSANGRKLAFVLPLPRSDVEFVLQFLRDNSLLPPP